MNSSSMTLKQLKVGESAVITSVGGSGSIRQHFLDMGVIPGAEVSLIKLAPMGDPMELQIHGYELTLRLDDAAQIGIKRIDKRSNSHSRIAKIEPSHHPGLGELAPDHTKHGTPKLAEDAPLSYALVGNQNCGKTTLFNQLTGSNQHVGNFPGVTVDSKDGIIKGYKNTKVTDLPGIYSMSPFSQEELVSRDFVLKSKPNAIINIVDATNIERNFYLTMQLLEMNKPMVVALNMMDEVEGNNGAIDINGLEALLGVPVVPISAAKNEGIEELISHLIHVARYNEKPLIQDFCSKDDHGGAVHRAIHAVEAIIEDHAERADIPVRFAATKVIEGDHIILESLCLDANEKELLEHTIIQMENESGMDRSSAIADMRFDFIERVCERTVTRPAESKQRIRSERIDRVLTGKWTALPCFILIMGLVFFLTFNVIGAFLQGLLESGIDYIVARTDALLTMLEVNPSLRGLVVDGIFGGVGSVLSFLPIVVTLFFFLSIMEDSGYIARVAFFMDKLLRKIGLSGRSIVPMLIGFGCTVPAVMASRTLPSSRDRRMTILLTPFMSCTAKLPIYAFFVNAFFPGRGGLIITGLYLFDIAIGLVVAVFYKKVLFKGEAVPFVMELPNYRMPAAKNVLQLLWDKAKDFITRAFSVIMIASVVVWFLQSFNLTFNLVIDSADSILAHIAGLIVPIMKPIGLGDWRIVTSLICGVMAKESVVSTMEVLFKGRVEELLPITSVVSMLIFSLIYTPCIAAISAIRRELGKKWAFSVIIWQCMLAYATSFIVLQLMRLF